MTFLDMCMLLKRSIVLVVVVPIACALVGLGIGFALPAEYETTATLNVSAEPASAESIAQQQAQRVASEQGVQATTEANASTRMVVVTVTGPSSEAVQDAANEVADQTQAEMDAMFADEVETRIVSYANSATDTSRSPVLYGVLGLLIGAFAIICLIVLRVSVKNTILDPREAEDRYDLSFLGSINVKKPEKTSKTLLANIQFAGNGVQRFCIVPVNSKDSANLVAQEIASRFHESNRSVKLDRSYTEGDLSELASQGADVTIVTVPSVEASDKASYAAHDADAVILAIEDNRSSYNHMDVAIHELTIARANIIGFVAVA